MRSALSLRIDDGVTDRLVTKHTSGLTFSKTAPGGHETLTARIAQPRAAFPNLGPLDRAYLYDTRTGRCVFDAYTANPTPVDGQAGQAFDLAAVGGMTLASDETRALLYIEKDLSGWIKDPNAVASSSADTGTWANDPAYTRVRNLFDTGNVVATGAIASAGHYTFDLAGMNLGGIRVGSINSGKSDAGYQEQFVTPSGVVSTRDMQVTGASLTEFVGAGAFPTGTRRIALLLRRVGGATNVADDLTWTDWTDVSLIGQRMDRHGNLLTGVSGLRSTQDVRASEVVEDIIGRLLGNTCDPAVSTLTPTTMPIYQLSWPDGATAQRVLDELARWEPDMLWEILDSTPAGHRFAYRAWPTDPRYEISVRDGYRETGSDEDLCNRISVTWTDPVGDKQTTVVTVTADQYPVLADLERAGRTRDADAITLEGGLGSAANALTIGTQKLAAINNAATAATAVVRRRIYDHLLGTLVDPWEIEPGYLAHVRETGQALRLTRMEYTDESCSTALTLGEPVLTDEQRIARLERVA